MPRPTSEPALRRPAVAGNGPHGRDFGHDALGNDHHARPATRDRAVERRAGADAALRTDPVVWLSSVQRDGRPHLVPVWFHWDGEQIVAFSKPHARKVDNLRDQPRVMLAVALPARISRWS